MHDKHLSPYGLAHTVSIIVVCLCSRSGERGEERKVPLYHINPRTKQGQTCSDSLLAHVPCGARTVPEHLATRYAPIAVLAACWTARPRILCPVQCRICPTMLGLCDTSKKKNYALCVGRVAQSTLDLLVDRLLLTCEKKSPKSQISFPKRQSHTWQMLAQSRITPEDTPGESGEQDQHQAHLVKVLLSRTGTKHTHRFVWRFP